MKKTNSRLHSFCGGLLAIIMFYTIDCGMGAAPTGMPFWERGFYAGGPFGIFATAILLLAFIRHIVFERNEAEK